jgi:hypothetical protein
MANTPSNPATPEVDPKTGLRTTTPAPVVRRFQASPGEYEGTIVEWRCQDIAMPKECMLLVLDIPGKQPGYFRWNTNSTSPEGFAFGKRIVSGLHPDLLARLAKADQLECRLTVHSVENSELLDKLIGMPVKITVTEGKPDPRSKEGAKFPNEWVPRPLRPVLPTREQLIALINNQPAEIPEKDLGAFGQ